RSALKVISKAFAVLVAIGASACAGAYRYVPLEEVIAQPKEDDCDFRVFEAPPDVPYDTLGILAPADIESESLDEDVEDFRDGAAKAVCRSGGDGLVAERDRDGRYVRGTVIKLK
ncbi:MAG TPA: hypothetical protein VGF45_00110, partial [Polyangia bacterium]